MGRSGGASFSQPTASTTPRERRSHQPSPVTLQAEAWWSNLEAEDFSKEENAFWCEETAAVAVEIPLPTSNRGMQAMVANPASYFVGAMKRRAVAQRNICRRQTKRPFARPRPRR